MLSSKITILPLIKSTSITRMVVIEQLLFNFGEKVDFINYCHNALNPTTCNILRITITRTLFDL